MNDTDFSNYKYIYPPNARSQEQLDIMLNLEKEDKDPLDIDIIDQEVLFKLKHWYVSKNRFPYEGIKYQFLIISIDPIYRIEDMSLEMWNELHQVWIKLKKDYDIPGGAFCFRFGDPSLSGASLKRLHAHLIMPMPSDKEKIKVHFSIGGRKQIKNGLILGE